jgi:hypothetical protein
MPERPFWPESVGSRTREGQHPCGAGKGGAAGAVRARAGWLRKSGGEGARNAPAAITAATCTWARAAGQGWVDQ